MKQSTTALTLVLVAQIFVLAVVYWPASTTDTSGNRAALLPAEINQADQWQIVDNEQNSVVLKRSGESWVLPELGGLPADSSKVNTAFDKLTGASAGWPIASSEPAQERFEVAEDQFQRKLVASNQGETIATLLLGTSPGFRNVHARNVEQQAIYSIAFNTFDIPSNVNDWLDGSLLQLSSPTKIGGLGYNLVHDDENWNSADQQPVDSEGLQPLLDALAYLQVNGIASEEVSDQLKEEAADIELSLTDEQGDLSLSLYKLDDEHYARSSRYSQLFTVSAYDFDRFADIETEQIFVGEDIQADASAESAAATAAESN